LLASPEVSMIDRRGAVAGFLDIVSTIGLKI
jgi:hypothetical protein